MSEQDLELEAFSKFIVAIEPWLGEVVLVGGWVTAGSKAGIIVEHKSPHKS